MNSRKTAWSVVATLIASMAIGACDPCTAVADPPAGPLETVALFTCPEVDLVWRADAPSHLCLQFGIQIDGEMRVFETPEPCEWMWSTRPEKVRGWPKPPPDLPVIFGEPIVLESLESLTTITRHDGTKLVVRETRTPSPCLNTSEKLTASTDLRSTSSFDSEKIVEECRRLRNERERDWCLLYQAAFGRNPALCPKAHSGTCESWIDNLDDGHANFGGRGSAISTLTGNDVRGTGERIDGKREGPWTGDYNTGVKAFSGFYRNGLRAEDWEEWYEDGSPKSKGRYIEGKKVGRWQEWRPCYGGVGEKREIGYLADQFHGPFTNWDREGNLVSQGSWLLGQRHGRLRQWSGNRATPDQWFANGRMVSKQEFLESYATGIERRAIEAEVDDEFAAFDRLCEEAKRSEDRYLDIWKNEFKRRNSISDDVFDNEIQVEEFSVVCSTAGATVRVTYRVTEGWASALVDDSLLILLYGHAATGPIHADLSVNRLFSEGDVRQAIDRRLNSIIHSYRSPRSLAFASRSDAEQALIRAVPTGNVQPDLWSIDFLSSSFSLGTYGDIDPGENRCFSASLDLSTGETQVFETVCAIYN